MHEFRHTVSVLADAMERTATTNGGPDEGDWVLLGVMEVRSTPQLAAVPIMEPKKRMVMRRYRTAEEAVGASVCHSATRVGGGWAVNVRTGDTVQVLPFRGEG
jgi:NADPH-dependent ferric siderophore reductase